MNNESSAKLPTLPVIAVTVFQFLVAALGLFIFVRGVRIEIAEYSAEYTHPPDPWYVLGGFLAAAVVCAVSATGLLMRRMWARWLTLILGPCRCVQSRSKKRFTSGIQDSISRQCSLSTPFGRWFLSVYGGGLCSRVNA